MSSGMPGLATRVRHAGCNESKAVISSGLNSRKLGRFAAWFAAIAAGIPFLFLGIESLWPEALASRAVVPAGAAVRVHLLEPVSSHSARDGSVFSAWVASGVSAEDVARVALRLERARIEGRCVAVRKAQAGGRPGYLPLTLSGLRDSEGHLALVESTTISLWGHSAKDPGASEAVVAPESSLTSVLLAPASVNQHRREP